VSDENRGFGAEMSFYSLKVLAYFRYKGIPHQWLSPRAHEEEFQKYARLPNEPWLMTVLWHLTIDAIGVIGEEGAPALR
jgi:hypothetical protein